MRDRTLADLPFNLRAYQQEAAEAFYQDGQVKGGSGTIVLPRAGLVKP